MRRSSTGAVATRSPPEERAREARARDGPGDHGIHLPRFLGGRERGRTRISRDPAALSAFRLGGARCERSAPLHGGRCARRDGGCGRDTRCDRNHESARDGRALGEEERRAGGTRHRLAGPPHRRALYATRGGCRCVRADRRAHRTGGRSLLLLDETRVDALTRRSAGACTQRRTAGRDCRQLAGMAADGRRGARHGLH